MRSNTRRVCFLVTCVCASVAIRYGRITAADPQRVEFAGQELRRIGDQGAVASTPPERTVYSNTFDPVSYFYHPGAGERMADDLELAEGACELVYYDLRVYSAPGTPRFNVHTELWDDDPCLEGVSVIAGTEAEFISIPSGRFISLEVSFETSPVAIPGTAWLAATFSTSNAGWLIAEGAEIGFTADFYSEDDLVAGCVRREFGDPCYCHAGLWANVNCAIPDPPGACCDGVSCTELTEAECTSGTWQGPLTTCDPTACLPGACCTDLGFTTCNETTQAPCAEDSGLFHPGATCDESPCRPAFKVYEDNFNTGWSYAPDVGTMWGDDLVLGPGPPCELAAYDITMVANLGSPPYDVHVTLWTNDNRGTPLDETDDIPLTAITGTAVDFTGVPADRTAHVLLAGPFDEIVLPENVWVVFSTSSDQAGPLLGGMADIGSSEDLFAIFNVPTDPGIWNNFWFGGFNPEGCPYDDEDPTTWSCNPAGSFRINVWCAGTGACCNDGAGTCVDGVMQPQCDGRWAAGTTCDSDPFDPLCGINACCFEQGCTDGLRSYCASLFPSAVAVGSFCDDPDFQCPRAACLGAEGNCFADNGTPGCDDAFCCEIVCADDDYCCTAEWHDGCAGAAQTRCPPPSPPNDHCADADPIVGEGSFDFRNSAATTDGPPHTACSLTDGADQTTNDVWFCWTAPCEGNVSISTCDQTTVNTKIAVYRGCATCPPTDADLLACNDDACTMESQQSTVVFNATTGQSYLIRIGTSPGVGGSPRAEGGLDQFIISCGVPDNPGCPGAGDCCTANASPGCEDEACCEKVCACDPSCCEVEWTDACAGHGADESGCGAAVLCAACRVPGDLDGDGDEDLDDLRIFLETCFRGPGTTSPAACIPADFDGNKAGDLKDFAGFQNAFSPP